MNALKKLFILIGTYFIFITPFFITYSSLYPALLIQGAAFILLITSSYRSYKRENDKKSYIAGFCLITAILYTIIYFCPFYIQRAFLLGMYGFLLVRIGIYLFSEYRKELYKKSLTIKLINLLWAGMVINFGLYPYVESKFIDVKNFGSWLNVSFINSGDLIFLLGASYLVIVIIQALIDSKRIRGEKSIEDVLFYLFFTGLLIFAILMIRWGLLM